MNNVKSVEEKAAVSVKVKEWVEGPDVCILGSYGMDGRLS